MRVCEELRYNCDSVGDINISAETTNKTDNSNSSFMVKCLVEEVLVLNRLSNLAKNNALNVLINRNLKILMGRELGIAPSVEEIKKAIKTDYKVFQVDGKFSLNVYKDVLRQNQWTPQDFEQLIKDDLTANQAKGIFESFPVSSKYFDQVEEVKKIKAKGNIVQMTREGMRENLLRFQRVNAKNSWPSRRTWLELNLNSKKIKRDTRSRLKSLRAIFLLTPKNLMTNLPRKKSEELLKKLTPKNFAKMAKTKSHGPSAKDGGNLDWFSKGRMVPEFEKASFQAKRARLLARSNLALVIT